MNKKKTVYAVCGDNGIIIVDNYYRVQQKLHFSIEGRRWAKKCSSFREAEQYALNHLKEIAPMREVPKFLKINSLIIVENLLLKSIINEK